MHATPATPSTTQPRRVFAATEPWPLHDAASTRRLEARALAHSPPHALMARAGLAVARLAQAVAPHARRITVLAGPGNNGGDGLIAALHLHHQGRQVEVVLLADPARLPADAANALRQVTEAGIPLARTLPVLHETDLLIDGLLGLGASRAPEGPIAQAIRAANSSARPVLAIDLPSGLNIDTGQAHGDASMRADWTLSLLTLKPGLFTALGRDLAGEVWIDDLGVADEEPATAWLGAPGAPPPGAFPARRHAQHKGSFGDLTVVGGAEGMQGAADLAARAALTAGAGRVYQHLLANGPPAALSPEVMRSPGGWLADAAALSRSTVVCGCGGGAAVAAALPTLLQRAGRLVLDADALNGIASDHALQALLQARGTAGAATVLTPHPLEAARLLGCTTAAVQADRLAAATGLVARFGSVVLLKGSGTVIAAPACAPCINPSGNAALAAPGSGDVLAGWIGGLWVQQPGDAADGAWLATRAATWLHGHAADCSHPQGQVRLPLRATDLIEAMARALR